jgi:hypothetical protein
MKKLSRVEMKKLMGGGPKPGPSCPRDNCHYVIGGVLIDSYCANGQNPFGTGTTCNCVGSGQWCAPSGA